MKALVGAFNQEKALVGAFSVIVKTSCGTDGSICGTSHNTRTGHMGVVINGITQDQQKQNIKEEDMHCTLKPNLFKGVHLVILRSCIL